MMGGLLSCWIRIAIPWLERVFERRDFAGMLRDLYPKTTCVKMAYPGARCFDLESWGSDPSGKLGSTTPQRSEQVEYGYTWQFWSARLTPQDAKQVLI